jgi:pimeloyl-ACP methyl ester carboxylesterase
LCNPFGEEAARAHRIYRVMATQLERAGYPVLRFDYSGTGDSMGDGEEATVEAWLGDVVTAEGELRSATGAKKTVAIGLGLGGTLAALATVRKGLKLRHLLLWDPVIDGTAYLRELAAAHRQYMRVEMGSTGWVDRLAVSEAGVPSEALGVVITPALGAEIGSVDLVSELPRAEHITVVSTQGSDRVERLRERLAKVPTAKWIAMTSSVPWNSDAALNSAVVPMDIVQALFQRVEEVSP